MRLIGLEPTRRETPDPKSGASTNFATGAQTACKDNIKIRTDETLPCIMRKKSAKNSAQASCRRYPARFTHGCPVIPSARPVLRRSGAHHLPTSGRPYYSVTSGSRCRPSSVRRCRMSFVRRTIGGRRSFPPENLIAQKSHKHTHQRTQIVEYTIRKIGPG